MPAAVSAVFVFVFDAVIIGVPAGVAAGLHLVAWLPPDLDEATVITAAAGEGVAVAGVTPHRLSPAPSGGLIFGYSDLNEHAITDGIARLARAVSSLHEA